jgi:ABC-type lipoprotein release transport system permease subunit
MVHIENPYLAVIGSILVLIIVVVIAWALNKYQEFLRSLVKRE